ncbi:MAG: hypothetical protein HN509_14255 [Halobacteriovoraceae bacterium]|jgi:hypothetical protein|nr:hypothetical protein [Halobacteriovoraceae bacterium]MBT5094153.1 hypothetical protein [Halobacteriovoraceae bacterium]
MTKIIIGILFLTGIYTISDAFARVPSSQVINQWLDLEDMRSPASTKSKTTFIKHFLYCGNQKDINQKIINYYDQARISFDNSGEEVVLGLSRGPAGHVIRDLVLTPVQQYGKKSICVLFSIN